MPELPEIYQYATRVNSNAATVVFDRVVFASNVKESSKFSVPKSSFKIFASTRGKQLQLTLTSNNDSNNSNTVSIVIGFGLVGIFKLFSSESELPSEFRFALVSSSNCVLALCDTMKMASWKLGTFDTDRGLFSLFSYF